MEKSISEYSHIDMSLVLRIGQYILKKNALRKERQRHRARSQYFLSLINFFKSEKAFKKETGKTVYPKRYPRGYKKWNKPGNITQLTLLHKKHLIEQLKAESEAHELVLSTRKELNDIKKKMPYTLSHDTNYIYGLTIESVRSIYLEDDLWLDIGEIKQFVEDQVVEDILLKNPIQGVIDEK